MKIEIKALKALTLFKQGVKVFIRPLINDCPLGAINEQWQPVNEMGNPDGMHNRYAIEVNN